MNPDVHGILVQLPLPSHINEQTVIERVAVSKDVDGLHPLNVAKLASTNTHSAGGRGPMSFDAIDYHVACTPQGKFTLYPHFVRSLHILLTLVPVQDASSSWTISAAQLSLSEPLF
jgi:5,10-methylene-tetrahydrofolate dehydrogenase/methenyl tetrahydrofolate cyclohydrolase